MSDVSRGAGATCCDLGRQVTLVAVPRPLGPASEPSASRPIQDPVAVSLPRRPSHVENAMTDPTPHGFYIAVEAVEPNDTEMAKYAAHLASNLTADLMLHAASNAEVLLLHKTDKPVGRWQDDLFDFTVRDGMEVSFDLGPKMAEARERLVAEVAGGTIVVSDRAGYHLCQALDPDQEADLASMLAHATVSPDLVVFLDGGEGPMSTCNASMRRQFLALAEADPRIHVIAIGHEHATTCDQVWQAVRVPFHAWAMEQRATTA